MGEGELEPEMSRNTAQKTEKAAKTKVLAAQNKTSWLFLYQNAANALQLTRIANIILIKAIRAND